MGDRTMEYGRTFLESDTGANLMGLKQQQAPISQLQTTSTMPFLTESLVQQKEPIIESMPAATTFSSATASPILSSSMPAATMLPAATSTSLPAATAAMPTGSTGYVKVSEQHFNENAGFIPSTQLAGAGGFISSSSAIPVGSSYSAYPYSSSMYTSEIVHGQYLKQDRYGNASVLRIKPKAILNQGLVYDVPCYIVSAEEDKKYLELPFKKSELALDQQVVLSKKNLFHSRMQRWIIRSDGFIEHETNRNMVLGVHKPADLINPTQVSELLVTAQNRRLIGENATGVKWTFVPAPYYGIARSAEEGQFFFIALAADPSWVLDVARLASTKDIKSGFRVVLRKNAGFTDNRQKWLLKPYYPSF